MNTKRDPVGHTKHWLAGPRAYTSDKIQAPKMTHTHAWIRRHQETPSPSPKCLDTMAMIAVFSPGLRW